MQEVNVYCNEWISHENVSLLLEGEANIHAEDQPGQTAIVYAVIHDVEEIVELLVYRGGSADKIKINSLKRWEL